MIVSQERSLGHLVLDDNIQATSQLHKKKKRERERERERTNSENTYAVSLSTLRIHPAGRGRVTLHHMELGANPSLSYVRQTKTRSISYPILSNTQLTLLLVFPMTCNRRQGRFNLTGTALCHYSYAYLLIVSLNIWGTDFRKRNLYF